MIYNILIECCNSGCWLLGLLLGLLLRAAAWLTVAAGRCAAATRPRAPARQCDGNGPSHRLVPHGSGVAVQLGLRLVGGEELLPAVHVLWLSCIASARRSRCPSPGAAARNALDSACPRLLCPRRARRAAAALPTWPAY
eukprot:350228-Chlamydomonas_euryale.AAC.6